MTEEKHKSKREKSESARLTKEELSQLTSPTPQAVLQIMEEQAALKKQEEELKGYIDIETGEPEEEIVSYIIPEEFEEEELRSPTPAATLEVMERLAAKKDPEAVHRESQELLHKIIRLTESKKYQKYEAVSKEYKSANRVLAVHLVHVRDLAKVLAVKDPFIRNRKLFAFGLSYEEVFVDRKTLQDLMHRYLYEDISPQEKVKIKGQIAELDKKRVAFLRKEHQEYSKIVEKNKKDLRKLSKQLKKLRPIQHELYQLYRKQIPLEMADLRNRIGTLEQRIEKGEDAVAKQEFLVRGELALIKSSPRKEHKALRVALKQMQRKLKQKQHALDRNESALSSAARNLSNLETRTKFRV
jgi:hypothetical protein